MSTYTNNIFTKHINEKIKVIFECGSRDCLDAIEMKNYYKPEIIYSFECNPDSIIVCKNNIKNHDNIILVDKAVGDKNAQIDFYKTDMEKSIDKNIGASSVLYHRDNKNEFFQEKIIVDSIRLDDFMFNNNIEYIDLLCLDLQGYEKNAILGLGDKVKNVKYIISEISYRSYYHGDVLFNDYNELLKELGFELVEQISYGNFGDALFKNKNI